MLYKVESVFFFLKVGGFFFFWVMLINILGIGLELGSFIL